MRTFGLGSAGTDNSAARTGGEWTAVHLLSADEVKSLFKDVVEGLRFLVLIIPSFFIHLYFTAGLTCVTLCIA